MDKEILANLHKITDKEISEYEELQKLYVNKKEILVAHKPEELWDVDALIKEKLSQIKQLAKIKKSIIVKNFPVKTNNISLIEIAQEIDEDLAAKFVEQKEKLQEIAKTIVTLEYTVKELIKQGIDYSGKMINNLSGESFLNLSEYNEKGQNNKIDGLSSIEQDV